VSGWVRNCKGGEVEALFSGAGDAVEGLLIACRTGPRHAHVVAVDVIGPGDPVTGAFTIRHDRSN
jgi:acylphosphatase